MSDFSNLEPMMERLLKQEVFEDDEYIYYTYEVDEDYRAIVVEGARAIYRHDKTRDAVFPTGNVWVDDPYLCRADDALRVMIPLLRAKFAKDLKENLH